MNTSLSLLRINPNNRRRILPLAIAAAFSYQAQAKESFALEEVVVTAQKRAESVQDVPIAISAMSAEFAGKVGAQTVDDLGIHTPGLETRVTQPTQPSFSIRGITTNDFGIAADPAVAVYVDGVYSGRSGAAMTAFQDLERVEVLKGPQGTLFGKNAAAGAIHLISNKPSMENEASIKLSVGNYGKRKLEAMVNTPLSDSLALRINVMDNETDGYIKNTVNGDDLAYENNSGVRAMLSWQASDNTDVLLQIDHADVDQSAAIDSGTLLDKDIYDKNVSLDVTPKETLELWGGSLTVVTDFDAVTFTSITAMKRFDSNNLRDQDGTNLFTPGVGGLYFVSENVEENRFFSQEFRLSSQLDENLRWNLGAMYSKEKGKQDSRADFSTDVVNAATGGILGLPGGGIFAEIARGDLVSTSTAVYGDMTYAINEQWDLTVGLRYTEDEKDYELTVPGVDVGGGNNAGVVFPRVGNFKQDENWDNLSSRVVLDYSFSEDALLYLSYATGYKAGAFNSTQPSEPIDEELVTNLELGLKSVWMDSRLRINAAIYSYEYEDLQEYGSITGAGGLPLLVIRNQDAEGDGFEIDVTWAATENLTLSANYNYLDTEITRYPLLGGEGPSSDRKGKSLPNVADNTYSLGAEYVVSLSNIGDLSLRTDYSYVGSRDSGISTANPAGQALLDQRIDDLEDSYTNLSARATLESSDGRWRVSLWGRNLTDEQYLLDIDDGSADIGATAAIRNTPRTYGLDVGYTF